MIEISQRKLNSLRKAIAEDTSYFEQNKDHFMMLFGEDKMPEKFMHWVEKYEEYLKILLHEERKNRNEACTQEQFSLSAYTVFDFKRYQKRLEKEINLLLV